MKPTFWKVFYVLNGGAILFLMGTIVWAAFNLHERLPLVMLAQIPPLVMMGIRRAFR